MTKKEIGEFLEVSVFFFENKDLFRRLEPHSAGALIAMIAEENCYTHGKDVVEFLKEIAETSKWVNAVDGKFNPFQTEIKNMGKEKKQGEKQ